MSELQRKANAYLAAVSAAPGYLAPARGLPATPTAAVGGDGGGGHPGPHLTLEGVLEAYRLYDWARPPLGALVRPAFERATARVGFPFTRGEIRAVMRYFAAPVAAVEEGLGDEIGVDYKRFLEWAAPAPATTAALTAALPTSVVAAAAGAEGGRQTVQTVTSIMQVRA